jgi:hypothetical protein
MGRKPARLILPVRSHPTVTRHSRQTKKRPPAGSPVTLALLSPSPFSRAWNGGGRPVRAPPAPPAQAAAQGHAMASRPRALLSFSPPLDPIRRRPVAARGEGPGGSAVGPLARAVQWRNIAAVRELQHRAGASAGATAALDCHSGGRRRRRGVSCWLGRAPAAASRRRAVPSSQWAMANPWPLAFLRNRAWLGAEPWRRRAPSRAFSPAPCAI